MDLAKTMVLLGLAGCGSGLGELGHRLFGSSQRMLPDDFSTVVAADHPAGAGQYEVWYDATHNTFGGATATTVGGLPALRIDDGGFTNGVYSIYQAAIPADGQYQLQATIHVVEPTAFDGIRAWQMGAVAGAGAVHRGVNPSALAALPAVGRYAGLTTGNDTAVGPQVVLTTPFVASAGDDLLVAFGTDVTSGAWNQSSSTWSGSHVLVSDLQLVAVDDPGLVVDNDDGSPRYLEAGTWFTGTGVGHAGGTYRYTFAGNAASATWTAELPTAGFYEVEATWLAGTNRASSAVFAIDSLQGRTEVAIDQTTRSLSWVKLGLFEFGAGPATVTLDAALSEPAQSVVIADAIRFVPSDGPPPIDDPEMRLAVITVFDDINDTDSIQRTVDELAALHYNAVAVHARYRGDATYFPNLHNADFPNLEPRSSAAGDLDVLAEFTERGHRAGLQVFAYVNTHLVTSGSTPETRPEHVVNAHPDWRTYAYNGGNPIVQTSAEDAEGLWLEPGLPEVKDYLADIAGDIMSNYDCDGIILDRIRYPQTGFVRTDRDFGYHPDAVARFNLLYWRTGVPDPNDPDWIEFRQWMITETVAEIYRTITEIDPNHLLLAYPIGRFDDARDYNYQDWPTWLNRNVIDGVLPQIYSSDPAAFASALDEHALAYGGDRLLGVTTDAFRAGVDVAGQLELARDLGFDGASPFRHGTMASLGYLSELEVAWDGVAAWPVAPGKGQPIADLQLCGDRAGPVHVWTVSNPNPERLYLTWLDLANGQLDTFYAAPGDTSFETPKTGGRGLMAVSWYDEAGHPQLAVALSGWPGCP